MKAKESHCMAKFVTEFCCQMDVPPWCNHKVVIELSGVEFWSEIILVISNPEIALRARLTLKAHV